MAATPGIDFVSIAQALREDDVDAAIRLGLLEWEGDVASLAHLTLPEADIVNLLRVRNERLTALAARDRYRARTARLERLQTERRQRQAESVADTPAGTSALSGAAAAALARALQKAKR